MAEKHDPELDELLDSAAKDFKKPDEASSSSYDPSQFLNSDGSINIDKFKKFQEEQVGVSGSLLKQFEKEFSASDIAKELSQTLQEGLTAAAEEQGLTPEEISNRLKNLNLFGDVPATDADKEKEFSDAIMGAMQSMRESITEAFPVEREGEDGEGEDALGKETEHFTNVMHQIMLTVLSKELILPSFKEMSEKYPAWLEENKSKLSKEEFDRYTAQLEVVLQIVAQLEKEGLEDDTKHLERMVDLMGKAQELGSPPESLTAQLGNAIDGSKMEALMQTTAGTGMDQCSIM